VERYVGACAEFVTDSALRERVARDLRAAGGLYEAT
jgi:hypothetical protein